MAGARKSFVDAYTKTKNSQEKGFLTGFDNLCKGINTYSDRIKYNADLSLIPDAPEPRFISNGTKLTCLMGVGESRLSLWNSHGTNDSAPDAVIATDITFTLFSECKNPLNPTKICTGKLLIPKWQNTHKGSTINQEEKVTMDSFLICEFKSIIKAKDDGQVFILMPNGHCVPLESDKSWQENLSKFWASISSFGGKVKDTFFSLANSSSAYAGFGFGLSLKATSGLLNFEAGAQTDVYGLEHARGNLKQKVHSSAGFSAEFGEKISANYQWTSERDIDTADGEDLFPIGSKGWVEWSNSDKWTDVSIPDPAGEFSISVGGYIGIGGQAEVSFDYGDFLEDIEEIWGDD